MTITKAQLINMIVDKQKNVTRSDVQATVNTLIDKITEEVAKGNKVEFAKFGSFNSVTRAERKGRNPQTGETITIPSKNVPVFRPGKNFKETVLAANK